MVLTVAMLPAVLLGIRSTTRRDRTKGPGYNRMPLCLATPWQLFVRSTRNGRQPKLDPRRRDEAILSQVHRTHVGTTLKMLKKTVKGIISLSFLLYGYYILPRISNRTCNIQGYRSGIKRKQKKSIMKFFSDKEKKLTQYPLYTRFQVQSHDLQSSSSLLEHI